MTDPVADFEDALGGETPDFEAKPEPALDLDQATQWVAELARIRRVRAEYEQAYTAAVARLSERRSQRLASLNEQEAWYAEALELYHRVVLANDKKAITIPTPAGTLTSRMGQPKWEFYDEDAFTAWALNNLPEVIADPPPPPAVRPAKNKVKKVLKDEAAKVLAVEGTSDAVLTYNDAPVPGLRVLKAKRNYEVVTE